MYKTVTVWVHGDEEKLNFQTNAGYRLGKDDAWIIIDDESSYSGSTSLHFDKAGLDQLIEELKVLQRDMKEAEDKKLEVLPKKDMKKEEVNLSG